MINCLSKLDYISPIINLTDALECRFLCLKPFTMMTHAELKREQNLIKLNQSSEDSTQHLL